MARKKELWNFLDRLKGDKVVWLITLMLFALSILCIFSSSTSLVTSRQDRLDIVRDQMFYVGIGLALVLVISNFCGIRTFRIASKFGFLVSFVLLGLLFAGKSSGGDLGFIHVEMRNGAVRALSIAGKQVYVYEIVKVAMVMYMARIVEDLKKDNFPLMNLLGKKMPFLKKDSVKRWVNAYIPFLLVCLMVMDGSNSSAIFIGGITAATLCIGTADKRDIITLLVCAGVGIAMVIGIYFFSGKTKFQRIGTLFSRTSGDNWEKIIVDAKPNSAQYNIALDNLRQPYSAKIAIHQGGLLGKGPGQSTQRYVVPDMCSDYMFSFIVEEYGFFGGLLVIILFASLLARGSIIIRNCSDKEIFAKTAIAGLVLLISLQAFMHITVNADIGPLTGQTLPILSNGTGAMLCFSIAFGVILSISRIALKGVSKETKEAEPVFELRIDDIDDDEQNL